MFALTFPRFDIQNTNPLAMREQVQMAMDAR